MDFLGSGPGWTITYWWPMSYHGYKTDLVWNLSGWQNVTAFVILLTWMIAIAYVYRRTPLELVAPRLDRKIIGACCNPELLAT